MRRHRTSWPLERVLFALAGSVTLVAAIPAATVSTWFLVLPLWSASTSGSTCWPARAPRRFCCDRACHLRSAIYDDNDRAQAGSTEVTV